MNNENLDLDNSYDKRLYIDISDKCPMVLTTEVVTHHGRTWQQITRDVCNKITKFTVNATLITGLTAIILGSIDCRFYCH